MTGTARDEAAGVARTAQQSGGQVASTAGEQASRVASEATAQARDLLKEGRGQLTEQAREGQRKAAGGLRTLSDQLQQMAERSEGQGMAHEVVRQAADRTRGVASWLEEREPGDLLGEVRRFARRKPGLFLAGAALAGVVVGRLTRGIVDAEKSGDDSSGQANGHRARHAADVNDNPPMAAPPLPATEPAPGYGTVPSAEPTPGYSAMPPAETAPGYGAVPPTPPPTPGYSTPPGEQR
ncbi:hypothetical protein JCM33774_81320 [Actinophytocola sp. KF-1]